MARLDPLTYRALFSAIDAGRIDVEIPDDAWAQLIGAYGHARAGRFVEARALVARATDDDSRGAVHLAAGRLLYVCRDHALSLAAFDRAAALSPRLAVSALSTKARHASRIGWAPEARRTLLELRDRAPRELRFHVELLRFASRAEDFAAALAHADDALEIEPRAGRIHMERAVILAGLERGPEAVRAADRAVALLGDEMPGLLEAARVGLEVGDYDMARRHLEAAERLDPRDVRPTVQLARLALFGSDVDGARQALRRARAHSPNEPSVERTEAAIDVLESRYDAAAATLERVVAAAPRDAEAHTWLAEARMRLGDFDAVYRSLHRATMNSKGFPLAAWIIRSLSRTISHDVGDGLFLPERYEEVLEGVDALVPGGRAEIESRDEGRVLAVLERALAALGGNRTAQSSHVVGGRLTALPIRTSPRHASRRALQLIRSAEPARAMAALDAVVARYPRSSLPICHRGELELWLGNLEAARRDLKAAIAIKEGTRWAWIGLTAIETLEGRPEAALAVSARGVSVMKGTVGASVYAYRGEAHMALGQTEEALADLERSVALSPSRLGARVALALVLDRRGEHDRAAEAFETLVEDAPGLLSDAAREEGVVLWKSRLVEPSEQERQRISQRALALLGGNRSSSCVTYRTGEGVLRIVPRPGGARPHDNEDTDLARIRTLLLEATRISRRRSSG